MVDKRLLGRRKVVSKFDNISVVFLFSDMSRPALPVPDTNAAVITRREKPWVQG